MTTNYEAQLDDLRPKEWNVSWEYPHSDHRWFADERTWPDEDAAIAHARALVAMEHATGDIRNVTITVRCTKLDATEWQEVQWSHDA